MGVNLGEKIDYKIEGLYLERLLLLFFHNIFWWADDHTFGIINDFGIKELQTIDTTTTTTTTRTSTPTATTATATTTLISIKFRCWCWAVGTRLLHIKRCNVLIRNFRIYLKKKLLSPTLFRQFVRPCLSTYQVP